MEEYLKDSGKVVLAWPYKDGVLEGGQDKEDTKRNEIFITKFLRRMKLTGCLSLKF